jgi:pimeloyl-ACP methyl ester carboxylesterase
MHPLRFYLEQHGFNTHGWELGTNKAGLNIKHNPHELSWDIVPPKPYNGEAGVPFLCDAMVNRVREFYTKTKKSVILVGWSLGGTIAREVARDLPEIVEHVVTLGSPLLGGPKYTAAATLLAKKGINLNWIENEVSIRNKIPLRCKSSSIISPTDGVVGFSAAKVPEDNTTRYIELDVSHLGMGINDKALATIVEELNYT